MTLKLLGILALWSFVVALSADFVCPTTHITKDSGITGTVPAGANGLAMLPAGQQCTYTFDIPSGFALKIYLSAVYDVSQVSPGVLFDGFNIPNGAVNQLEYAMKPQVALDVFSAIGNLTFLAKYEYLDLSNYQQVLKPTGAYFNTTLESNKYYTIQASTDKDQVNLHYGSRESEFVDSTVYEVFMFDGSDIFNSKYVGRVPTVFGRRQEYYSTSNSLTLINLYGSPSNSVFLGNDASVIDPMDFYGLFVVDSNKSLSGYMNLASESKMMPDAWYTVICNGCSSFTIDYIVFDDHMGFEPADPSGYVSVQKMTPTRNLPTLATYPYSTNNNGSFPQRITAPMATFHLHSASVKFQVTPVV